MDDFTFPAKFTVRAWRDELVEGIGFAIHHPYIELMYLPILGPSSTLAYRRLGSLILNSAEDVEVELVELAVELGLGSSQRSATLQRALRRLVMFGLAHWHHNAATLAIRIAAPPLPQRHLARLTDRLQHAHHALVAANH